MVKMHYKTKTGLEGEFEGKTMTEIMEQGRQLCREHNIGWPKSFVEWETVEEKPVKKGAKEEKPLPKPLEKTK